MLEFGNGFPALSDGGLTVELCDGLVGRLRLNSIQKDFEITCLGRFQAGSVEPDEDLFVGFPAREGDKDFLPSGVGSFSSAE